MTVEFAKPQDFLAVGNHGARIRALATYQRSTISNVDTDFSFLVHVPATRLAGLAIATDTIMALGTVTVTVERIRGAVAVTLLSSAVVLNTTTGAAIGVLDFSSAIDQAKDLVAGDQIKITTTGATTPTAMVTNYILQCAPNGR